MAAAAYSLAAIASFGLIWEIARRAARGRETTLLLGSIFALALHYVAVAADAFARTRVEKEGGRFQLESEPGRGTKVAFYLS